MAEEPFLNFEHPFNLTDDEDDGAFSLQDLRASLARIENQNAQILERLKMTDQTLTDLTAAVTNLGTAVTNETNEINAATIGIQSLLTQIQDANANNDSAAIESLVGDINNQVSLIGNSTGNLATAVAAIPPAPPAGNTTGNTSGSGTVNVGNTTTGNTTGSASVGNTTV
jgi:hypothetical protein